MRLEQQSVAGLLAAYQDMKLVSEPELRETLSLFEATHPLRAAVGAADSLHMHIKVDDTAALPRADIVALGGTPESEQAGYVKFAHGNGLNMIFSSIDVSVDGPLKTNGAKMGCDLRPIDPAHPYATKTRACCAGVEVVHGAQIQNSRRAKHVIP
jgi:hypothetical protein